MKLTFTRERGACSMTLVIEEDIVEWLKGEGSTLCIARDFSHSAHWKILSGDVGKTECEWDEYQLQKSLWIPQTKFKGSTRTPQRPCIIQRSATCNSSKNNSKTSRPNTRKLFFSKRLSTRSNLRSKSPRHHFSFSASQKCHCQDSVQARLP